MKKILTLLVLSSLTIVLSGCFAGKEVENDMVIENPYELSSFEGVIANIPSTISGIDATHVLTAENGENIYLRSVLFDLGRLVGSKVRVSGVLNQDGSAKVLLVEGRDILENDVVVNTVQDLRFERQGFDITIDTAVYTPTATNSFVNFVSNNLTFSVETIVKGFELDLEIYLGKNYANQVPQDIVTFKGDRFSKIVLGTGNYVYLRNTTDVIYELVFNSNQLSQAEVNVEIDKILQSITFTPEKVDSGDLTVQIVTDTQTNNSNNSNSLSNNQSQTETLPSTTVSQAKDLSDLSSDVVMAVEDFDRVKSDKIGANSVILSYALTDNNHLYVAYLSENETFRKLFKINSGVFEEVAFFRSGVQTDWELVSGSNTAFDRPQKVVFVEDSKFRQVDIKEGYRYFESRPMFFGFHYPKNWYFAGDSKIYRFSNKPITEGETLVLVELVDEKFEDVVFNQRISDNIVRNSSSGEIVYFIKKENNSVIRISGSALYTEQIDTMAQTFVEVSRS